MSEPMKCSPLADRTRRFDPITKAFYCYLAAGDEVEAGDECAVLRVRETGEWVNFEREAYRPVAEAMLGQVVSAKNEMLRFRRPVDSFRRNVNRLVTFGVRAT